MPTEILTKDGTPVVWADTTDYNSAGSGYTRTHQIDLTSLANGSAREGAKADLGATRAKTFSVNVGMEIDAAPTAGLTVDFYWYSSFSGTAGTGNAGGATGADAAWPADGDEDQWTPQLMYMGSLILTNDAATTVQRACINVAFSPPTRYGGVVVDNNSGQAFEGDAVEMYVALVPNPDESQ